MRNIIFALVGLVALVGLSGCNDRRLQLSNSSIEDATEKCRNNEGIYSIYGFSELARIPTRFTPQEKLEHIAIVCTNKVTFHNNSDENLSKFLIINNSSIEDATEICRNNEGLDFIIKNKDIAEFFNVIAVCKNSGRFDIKRGKN